MRNLASSHRRQLQKYRQPRGRLRILGRRLLRQGPSYQLKGGHALLLSFLRLHELQYD